MGHGKHSPNEMGHSPNEMSADLKYNTVVDIEEGKAEGDFRKPFTHKHFGSKSAMLMKGSPNHKYDRVVLGGNEGDKSKTKPGKKDYSK